MSKTDKPAIKVFQVHQSAFSFLGNENVLTELSDFGHIWEAFFEKGGYEPILPFAVDGKPINIWYTNDADEKIYSQGFFVGDVDEVPGGYTLVTFPASDFLVITTDWMETSDEAVGENGNGQCNQYAKTAPMPEGYVRNDGEGSPITAIEKENTDTPKGSRYEVWVPIKGV